ncbi:unnamed protein product [Parascedosporium putredinis]|uniref:Thioredoxin-like fold domain-containing protein n=1 Tax=Parascedosporium putredinis TaxID=1442378 RepID=A0A9P1MDB0_9PEZI|nr:unnamed protein product [Parascedosporium putredinis]CAI8002231.1 unnamed protein product [Parascedosporium putredinis]
MALPPKFAAHRVIFGRPVAPHTSVPPAAHVLEVFLDYCVQPWHPSSTLLHESAVVVNQQAPEKFWDYNEALFARATEFYDVNVVHETRNQTYARLAKLAAGVGLDETRVLEALQIPSEPVEGQLNGGNKATNDLKLLVKMARLTGVHVSPTVIFDGVVQNDTKSTIGASRSSRQTVPDIYTAPDPNKRYVVIYHAGTGRVLYLGVLKLTTIFLSVLFCGIFVPSYIMDDKPWPQTAAPLRVVPARADPARGHHPQRHLQAPHELLHRRRHDPAKKRMGIVNFERDTARENAARRWWMFRAVGGFNVQGSNKGVKEGWIWDAIVEKVNARAVNL